MVLDIGAQILVGFMGTEAELGDMAQPLPLHRCFVVVVDMGKSVVHLPPLIVHKGFTLQGMRYAVLNVATSTGTMKCCFGTCVRAAVSARPPKPAQARPPAAGQGVRPFVSLHGALESGHGFWGAWGLAWGSGA